MLSKRHVIGAVRRTQTVQQARPASLKYQLWTAMVSLAFYSWMWLTFYAILALFLFILYTMFQSKGNGVFNPNPAPAPSPGTSPSYNICGSSLTDAKETCDRICETNDDCGAGEACFSDLSSSDCDGKHARMLPIWHRYSFFPTCIYWLTYIDASLAL